MKPALLLHGHDTIECAYYLAALPSCTLDFEKLAVEKEALRHSPQDEARYKSYCPR